MPIKVNGLTIYTNPSHTNTILQNVNCSIQDLTLTLVIGRSGSGKTTLLRALAGLLEIDDGTVYYDDIPLWNRGRLNRSVLLQNSVAFQFPEHQLFSRTIQGEFDYSLQPYRLSKQERIQRTQSAIHSQQLPASYLEQSPFALSGGQKRRLALASIMATETPWLFLDEPSAGLDASSLTHLKDELKQWKQERSIVLVTHDVDTFLPIADRVLVLHNGQLVADVTPTELAQNPHLLEDTGIGLTESMKLIRALQRADFPISNDLRSPKQLAEAIDQIIRGETLPKHSAKIKLMPLFINDINQMREVKSHNQRSFLYQLNAQIKWLLYTLLSIGIVLQSSWLGTGLAFMFTIGCISLLIPDDRTRLLKMTKPLMIFTVITILFSGMQMNLEQGPTFSWEAAGSTLQKLFTLFIITLFGLVFTLSTSTSSMKQGLEKALLPLKRLKVPTEMLALSASLLLRFIPLIMEDASRFAAIAKARGKRTTKQGQIHVRDLPVFVIPLLMSLFQSVEELILAMEMKGFIGKSLPLRQEIVRDKQLEKRVVGTVISFFLLLISIRIFI